MKMNKKMCISVSHGVLDQQFLMFSIIMVIILTPTSTLQDNIKGLSPDKLSQALKENDKAETHLIRYMSDDMQIVEPNAIYLQCVVPQHLHAKEKGQAEENTYTITWVRELTAGDANNRGKVQILSRNGRVSRRRGAETGLERRSSMRNRIRSWIAQTTKGDEHVLMVRDTNRSLDEGIYSCQIHLNGNLVETRKATMTFEEGEYDYNYSHGDEFGTSMISNPILFGSTPQHNSPSKLNRQSSSSNSNPHMTQRHGDGPNFVAQEIQDDNPITARFVIAKRGMDVILECHDHDVTTSQEGNIDGNAKNTGLTQATVQDDQNYVWRKEGDSKNIIGHGRKLKLVKVDRWDNGLYYCSANVRAKEDSKLEGSSVGKRKTSFHLQVAAPRVSSNSPSIKDLGLDHKSLEKLKKTLHTTSTISSTLHIKRSGVLGRKDALHKNNILHQHAVFGQLGRTISLNCTAEGEPIPNVRWYFDKPIEEEAFQNTDEDLEIMKFVQSEQNDKTIGSYTPDSFPVRPSPSSFPFVTEGTSFSDIYSYDNGNSHPKVSTSDQSQKVMVPRFVKEEIRSGEEFAITINGYRDGGFESSLKIHNIQPRHFTRYYCEAQNSKGDDGLVIHLLKENQRRQKRVDLRTENAATMTKTKSSFRFLILIVIMTFVVDRYSI